MARKMEKFLDTTMKVLNNDALKLLWNKHGEFGEIIIFKNDNNEIILETECMGKQFVKDVLNDIIDNAIIKD